MTDPKAKPLLTAINEIVDIRELHHIEPSNGAVVSEEVAKGSLTEEVRKKLIAFINCARPEVNKAGRLEAGGIFEGVPCQIQLCERTSSKDGKSERT